MGLFTPKWMKNEKETAKLTDTEKLKKAALSSSSQKVKQEALEKLMYDDANQEFLKKFALEDPDFFIRKCAIYGIKDFAFLLQIAEQDPNKYIREIAKTRVKERILQQKTISELYEIAHTTDRAWLRKEAIDILLFKRRLPSNTEDNHSQLINDFLKEIAIKDSDSEVRRAAVAGIGDENLLLSIALEDVDSVATVAIKNIHNPKKLLDLILFSKATDEVKETAWEKLWEKFRRSNGTFDMEYQEYLIRLVKGNDVPKTIVDKAFSILGDQWREIKNQEMLYTKIKKVDSSSPSRYEMICQIDDPVFGQKIAEELFLQNYRGYVSGQEDAVKHLIELPINEKTKAQLIKLIPKLELAKRNQRGAFTDDGSIHDY